MGRTVARAVPGQRYPRLPLASGAGAGGKAVGSFFLCLAEAREPSNWERRVAEFGALATGIVIERERAAAKQRSELQALSRLQELSAELVEPGEFQPLPARILAAAADISGTDKGNIRLYDRAAAAGRFAAGARACALAGAGAQPLHPGGGRQPGCRAVAGRIAAVAGAQRGGRLWRLQALDLGARLLAGVART
ncbi:hypothetical protein [Comamonas antarctica]|uniref:hypothetical protein n=1 Tax=Comamonas antarctica TaxID=2743470 RepID=UPI0028E68214|nr:hypothetical protein [Comamonas antarctica]